MVRRGSLYWAQLPGDAGRRPVCVLTRDGAIGSLTSVTCAPLTRIIRGIKSEVLLDEDDGLPSLCVISCDNIATIPMMSIDPAPIAQLSVARQFELDRAIRFALHVSD